MLTSLVTPQLLLFAPAMLARMGAGASLDSLTSAFAGRLLSAQVRYLADHLVDVGRAKLTFKGRGERYISLEPAPAVTPKAPRVHRVRPAQTPSASLAVPVAPAYLHTRSCLECGHRIVQPMKRAASYCGPACALARYRRTSHPVRSHAVSPR